MNKVLDKHWVKSDGILLACGIATSHLFPFFVGNLLYEEGPTCSRLLAQGLGQLRGWQAHSHTVAGSWPQLAFYSRKSY